MDSATAALPWNWAMMFGQSFGFVPNFSNQATFTQDGPNEEQVQVNKLQAQLNAAKDEIDRISDELELLVVYCGNDTLDKLKLAIAKVYKLAVIVQSAYNDRDSDVLHRNNLLKQIVDSFQAIEDVAEAGLKAISDQHAAILELGNSNITPAKNEIELLVQQTKNKLANIKAQIRALQLGVETLERTVSD
jgi:peptidoglycan hydrolase CwlO-like protein